MEEKKNEITRLQDQEKALYASFQAAIGENNKFANFLMKVLKKRMKRVKKKEVEGDAGLYFFLIYEKIFSHLHEIEK